LWVDVLELNGVSKIYGQGRGVDGATLIVPDGQFVGIIGRSGAGKSTLLRMINRLAEPSAGQISWNGQDVTKLSGAALRDWRRRCAMIFQQFNLVGRLDVLNNVLIGRLATAPAWRAMTKLWSREDRIIAMAALEQMDIANLAASRADHLSGGQQQRVAICRALVQEPEIVLADEPVASLDPRNAKIVMDALLRINRHFGLTVLCNTHSLDLAREYCDRLIGMAHGRVVFDGTPADLTAEVARDLYGTEAGDVMPPHAVAEPTGALQEAAAG
jgi:phosphonate transport system ATP-binding protein